MTTDNKNDNGGDDESPNKELQELQDTLFDKVTELAKQIGKATDSNSLDILVREMHELNHRVTLTGSLLFTAETRGITAAMEKVRGAEIDVDKAIRSIDDLSGFIKGVTSFLLLVDKVIDTAKLVAV